MSYHLTIAQGNLGQTPELRQTKSGVPVTSFSLAVNETWKDADGIKQEKTTWYKVVCWRGLAETCAKYLEKGREVLVEGTMSEPTSWEDKDGNLRLDLNLTARTVKFGAGGSGNRSNGEPGVAMAADVADEIAVEDDEIPF